MVCELGFILHAGKSVNSEYRLFVDYGASTRSTFFTRTRLNKYSEAHMHKI